MESFMSVVRKLKQEENVVFLVLEFHETCSNELFDRYFNFLLDIFKIGKGDGGESLDFPTEDIFQKYKLLTLFTNPDEEGFNLESGLSIREEEMRRVAYALKAFLSVYFLNNRQIPIDDFFGKFALPEEKDEYDPSRVNADYFLNNEVNLKTLMYLVENKNQESQDPFKVTQEHLKNFLKTKGDFFNSTLKDASEIICSGKKEFENVGKDYESIIELAGMSITQNHGNLHHPKNSKMSSSQRLELVLEIEVVEFFQQLMKSRRFKKPVFESFFLCENDLQEDVKKLLNLTRPRRNSVEMKKSVLLSFFGRERENSKEVTDVIDKRWRLCSQIGYFSNSGFVTFKFRYGYFSYIIKESIVLSFSPGSGGKIMEEIKELMESSSQNYEEFGKSIKTTALDSGTFITQVFGKKLVVLEIITLKKSNICSIQIEKSRIDGRNMVFNKEENDRFKKMKNICDVILKKACRKIKTYLNINNENNKEIHPSETKMSEFLPYFEKYQFWKKRCRDCGKWGKTIDMKKCSGCKKVFYCSKVCQRKDWGNHKKDCFAK